MSGSYYTINIYGLLDMIPVRLFKNKIEDHCNYHNSLSKPITITQKGMGKYYGFELDGNNRYVLGSFDVTHNTSIVKDGISKILGRKFAFIALGGAGDSSFLEGHSYTYEGSTWGKIVQVMIDSKCMNPVIYFDELDKISDSPRGQEITSVLTHLTDTTQNDQFQDKFFSEINFDLSKCLFIFNYNDESKVNPILLDRMYRIQTKGYSFKEKMVIAKKYMLPKIREQVNFKEEDIIIPDDSLEYLISNTKFSQNEQGVRNLKRSLEIIHTKLNLFRLVKTESASIFGNELALKVEFPYTVTRHSIDALIKSSETENSGLLTMYV
jgi:ATP-dependent Lon protease